MSFPPPPFPKPPLHAGILNDSSQFTINGGNFQAIASQTNIYNTNSKLGLMELYRASLPEAVHDSSARKYVPTCYPGTRQQHIQDFTLWASNTIGQRQHRFRMSWMEGPFGVGKTTIAQTCAGKMGKDVGATFFFSRPNQRDDPDRFFPSIAYQMSTKIKSLADILDEKVCNDPSLLTKTMEIQFRELLVLPFLELKERGVSVQKRVVIIDGLDECKDEYAQCEIIELIAAAVREYGEGLPILWAFFSRPEPHLIQNFSSEAVSPLVWTMSLRVSREVDKEIELYIRGQFKNIQKRISQDPFHSNGVWPSESHILAVVRKSAGLFVHASTTMKYIGDPEALNPMDRLEEIVSPSLYLPKSIVAGGPSPTAELDSLYTLIMRRIPPHILPITQQILLLTHRQPDVPMMMTDTLTELLGFCLPTVKNALSKLHSVLTFQEHPLKLMTFHHTSFMEFLTDINRSGPKLCIAQPQHYGSLLKSALKSLESAQGRKSWTFLISANMLTVSISHWTMLASIDEELALLFIRYNFATYKPSFSMKSLEVFYSKLPVGYKDRVIRKYQPSALLTPQDLDSLVYEPAVIYVLGQGKKSLMYGFDKCGVKTPLDDGGRRTRADDLTCYAGPRAEF